MAIRKLKEKGIEIYFEKENIWTLDSKGELLITIMSSIAQEESRSISMNVTWGIKESMKQGKAYVPYKVFLGYEKGSGGEMIINEEQAKIVRKIYALSMINKSAYEIATLMEKENIPFSQNNNKWYPSTVKSILTNEKYKGDALRQKTYTKDFLTKEKAINKGEKPQYYIHNHHEPIIPETIFDRLQESLINKPSINDKRCHNYLISKKIICPYCHNYYGPVVWHPNTSKEVIVWRCNSKYKKEHSSKCLSPALKEDYIKQIFIKELANLIKNQETIISTLLKIIKRVVVKSKINSLYKYINNKLRNNNIISGFNHTIWEILLNQITIYSKSQIVVEWNRIL